MPDDDTGEDEYVARLLKQDALTASKKYDFVGMDAFKRSRPEAPKPNTNFLRHIIRQTDSHNAALRAREARESSARLRQLHTSQSGRAHRGEHDEDSGHKGSRLVEVRRGTRFALEPPMKEGRRHGKRCSERYSEDPAYQSHQRRGRRHHSDSIQEEVDQVRRTEYADDRRKRSRRVHSSRSRRRSASPAFDMDQVPAKRSYRSRSLEKRSGSPARQTYKRRSLHREKSATRRTPTPEEESDPLETIVGPLPPPKLAAVQLRGRGTRGNQSEGIDARFSSSYNPAEDTAPTVEKGEEWGDAVEAFRDRQRWKQQGGERLKAAGFSEEQVKRWEQGDEKTEEDVRWSAQGKAREWDRGKVVDEDGDVGFKAAWESR